jgi:hypothetical protein
MWEIELDAASAQEAARQAQRIHRDHQSTATVFDVIDTDTLQQHRIDLLEDADG